MIGRQGSYWVRIPIPKYLETCSTTLQLAFALLQQEARARGPRGYHGPTSPFLWIKNIRFGCDGFWLELVFGNDYNAKQADQSACCIAIELERTYANNWPEQYQHLRELDEEWKDEERERRKQYRRAA